MKRRFGIERTGADGNQEAVVDCGRSTAATTAHTPAPAAEGWLEDEVSGVRKKDFDDAVARAGDADGFDRGVRIVRFARRQAGERDLGGSGIG